MHDSERDRIFGAWLAGHKGILFKVVHAYAFEHADRQDLFQEITIQIWRSVDAFRGDSSVPTWMYRVALNTAIAWTRKEVRHQRGKEPFDAVEGLLTTSSSEGLDPRLEWLYQQIAQLKDVDRSVALLLLDGFSYKEIASIVGLTESNVGVKIYRIKSALAGKRAEGNGIMNLDELMSVWRTQDAAPLHDVNKTLLHLALRQDEAKLQKERRIERWVTYAASAGMVGAMAVFLGMMMLARDRKVMTGWDFASGIVGAAAALVAGGAMYVGYRAQARREQRFGESLRDQLSRRIAQFDDAATRAYRTGVLVIVAMGGICPTVILLLGLRVNQKSISDDGGMLIPLILTCVWLVATGVWEMRRRARELLSRKLRLEALLKELDGQ